MVDERFSLDDLVECASDGHIEARGGDADGRVGNGREPVAEQTSAVTGQVIARHRDARLLAGRRRAELLIEEIAHGIWIAVVEHAKPVVVCNRRSRKRGVGGTDIAGDDRQLSCAPYAAEGRAHRLE